MFLNPIGADTGLRLRPVAYERKAGLPLKKDTAAGFQTIETLTPQQISILNAVIKNIHFDIPPA